MTIRRRALLCLLLLCLVALPACRQSSGTGEESQTTVPSADPPVDLPYSFTFASNGDGTCDIVEIRFDSAAEAVTLRFPSASPDGERVAGVRCEVEPLLPVIIAAEDFEQHLLAPLAERVGEESETYRSFAGAWEKLNAGRWGLTESEAQSIRDRCPMAAVTPVYVYRAAPSYRNDALEQMKTVALLGYTEEDLRADYRHLTDLAKASGLPAEQVAAACAQVPSGRTYCPFWVTGIELPADLGSVDGQLWSECPWLERLVLPSCVQLGYAALAFSESLREVVLPEGVTALGERAFAACPSLERVTLPASLLSLPPYLFDGCGALGEIVFTGSLSEWQALCAASEPTPGNGAKTGSAIGIPVRCTDGSGIYGEAIAEPYRLTFTSNGDGTCTVTHVWFNPNYSEPFTLEFPAVSPDGEPVSAVRYEVGRLIPRWIPKRVFDEQIRKPLIEAVVSGQLQGGIPSGGNPEDNFYYRCLMIYFQIQDPALETDPEAAAAMLEAYPITAEMPIYTFASDASADEINKVESSILQLCPGYTPEQMESDHRVTGYTAYAGAAVVYPVNLTGIVFAPEIAEVSPGVYADCGQALERLVLPTCAVLEGSAGAAVPRLVDELVIPEGVSRIGGNTLQHCDTLRLLWIPHSVTEIAEWELQSLDTLEEIRYAGTLAEWQALRVPLPDGVTVTCADSSSPAAAA